MGERYSQLEDIISFDGGGLDEMLSIMITNIKRRRRNVNAASFSFIVMSCDRIMIAEVSYQMVIPMPLPVIKLVNCLVLLCQRHLTWAASKPGKFL